MMATTTAAGIHPVSSQQRRKQRRRSTGTNDAAEWSQGLGNESGKSSKASSRRRAASSTPKTRRNNNSTSTSTSTNLTTNLYQQRQQQLLQATMHYDSTEEATNNRRHQQQKMDGDDISNNTPDNDSSPRRESMDVEVTVLQGQDLAPKDRNWMGAATSSDPYVVAKLISTEEDNDDLSEEVLIGKTRIISNTLNPVWKENPLKITIPTKTTTNHQLQLKILDYDLTMADDLMGIITIPLPTDEPLNEVEQWYDIPHTSANNAKGRLQLSLKTRVNNAVAAFAEATQSKEEEEVEQEKSKAEAAAEAGKEDADESIDSIPDNEQPEAASNQLPESKESSQSADDKSSRNNTIESMNLAVTVVAGAGLAPKDRNIMGVRHSSDPYVKVQLLTTPQGSDTTKTHDLGQTKTVFRSLEPVFNERLEITVSGSDLVQVKEAKLQLTVMDYDVTTADDCMGVVVLPILIMNASSTAPRWYDIPSYSANNASGRLQVAYETEVNFTDPGQLRRSVLGNTVMRPTVIRRSSVRQLGVQQKESEEAQAFCTPRRTHRLKKRGSKRNIPKCLSLDASESSRLMDGSSKRQHQLMSKSSRTGVKQRLRDSSTQNNQMSKSSRTGYSRRRASSPPAPPLASSFESPRITRGTRGARNNQRMTRSAVARSKDSSAFCTPRRTRQKLALRSALPPKLAVLASPEADKEVMETPSSLLTQAPPSPTPSLGLEDLVAVADEDKKSKEKQTTKKRKKTKKEKPPRQYSNDSCATTKSAPLSSVSQELMSSMSALTPLRMFAQTKKFLKKKAPNVMAIKLSLHDETTTPPPQAISDDSCSMTPSLAETLPHTNVVACKDEERGSRQTTKVQTRLTQEPKAAAESPANEKGKAEGEDQVETQQRPKKQSLSPETNRRRRRKKPMRKSYSTNELLSKRPVASSTHSTDSHKPAGEKVIRKTRNPGAPSSIKTMRRRASQTWICCCGYESKKERPFCGMCGSRQLWTCKSCDYEKNLCRFKFCGMCGTTKEGEPTAKKESDPVASAPEADTLGCPSTPKSNSAPAVPAC